MTPTGIVRTWIGNDVDLYHTVCNAANRAWKNTKADASIHLGSSHYRHAVIALSDDLKRYFNQRLELLMTARSKDAVKAMLQNLLQHAFDEIDWEDLADDHIANIVRNEGDERDKKDAFGC